MWALWVASENVLTLTNFYFCARNVPHEDYSGALRDLMLQSPGSPLPFQTFLSLQIEALNKFGRLVLDTLAQNVVKS